MNQALTYLYYIFDKFVSFVFNDMEIATNVTFGWVAVSVILFSLMIRSILNVPRSVSFAPNKRLLRRGKNE